MTPDIFKSFYVVLLIITNIALQVFAFVLVKFATMSTDSYLNTFFSAFYFSALLLVLAQAIVWQLILKKRNLSEVYPVNSLVPPLILLAGFIFSNEAISPNNIMGALVLMIGIFLIVDNKQNDAT